MKSEVHDFILQEMMAVLRGEQKPESAALRVMQEFQGEIVYFPMVDRKTDKKKESASQRAARIMRLRIGGMPTLEIAKREGVSQRYVQMVISKMN